MTNTTINLVENKVKALQIIKRNFEELIYLWNELDRHNNPQDNQPNISLGPEEITGFDHRGLPISRYRPQPKPSDESLKDLVGNNNIDIHYSKAKAGGLLPIIFVTKTVSEWSDESGSSSISINCHGLNRIGSSQLSSYRAIVEMVVIRHAFIHRGNKLEFEQSRSNILHNSNIFPNQSPSKLNITKIEEGESLITNYSLYCELFKSAIGELENHKK